MTLWGPLTNPLSEWDGQIWLITSGLYFWLWTRIFVSIEVLLEMWNFALAATTRMEKPKTIKILQLIHSFTSFFWPQKTGTSAHNKRPLIFFIATSWLPLMFYSFHILKGADASRLSAWQKRRVCSASHLMPVTANGRKENKKSILPKINILRWTPKTLLCL